MNIPKKVYRGTRRTYNNNSTSCSEGTKRNKAVLYPRSIKCFTCWTSRPKTTTTCCATNWTKTPRATNNWSFLWPWQPQTWKWRISTNKETPMLLSSWFSLCRKCCTKSWFCLVSIRLTVSRYSLDCWEKYMITKLTRMKSTRYWSTASLSSRNRSSWTRSCLQPKESPVTNSLSSV